MTTPAPESLTPPTQPGLPTEPPPAAAKPAQFNKMPYVAGIFMVMALCAGGIIWGSQRSASTPTPAPANPLADAKNACARDLTAVQLADGDKTLLVDGAGEEDDGVSTRTIACLLEELRTPAAVIAKMDGTNALQGRQEATWEGFTASWTYHPDRGLDLIVQAKG